MTFFNLSVKYLLISHLLYKKLRYFVINITRAPNEFNQKYIILIFTININKDYMLQKYLQTNTCIWLLFWISEISKNVLSLSFNNTIIIQIVNLSMDLIIIDLMLKINSFLIKIRECLIYPNPLIICY